MKILQQKQGLWARTGLPKFDLISMSLFRIAFATYIAYTAAWELTVYDALDTDHGVMPRSLLLQDFPRAFTLLDVSDYALFHFLFHVTEAVALIAFAIGYRTRPATVILMLIEASKFWRHAMGATHVPLLRELLLVWSCFLPLNRYWSVDAALDRQPRDRSYPLVPLLALKLQLSSIYFFSALFKLAGPAWIHGKAVTEVLGDDLYGRTPASLWCLDHIHGLLHWSNYGVIIFQLFFSCLAYSPWFNNWTRAFALAGAAAMHFSFLVFLHVGTFPQLCFCYLILLVPDTWWERLFAPRRRRLAAMRIYYDTECDFCRKVALLLREFCLPTGVPVSAADTDPAALALLQQHHSWVVYDAAGKVRLKWDAVAYVLRQSPVLFPLGWLTGWGRLRPYMARIYDFIGAHRPFFGRLTSSYLPWRDERAPGAVAQAFCAFLALLALSSNVLQTPAPYFIDRGAVLLKGNAAADDILGLASLFQVKQMWNIFAPNPNHRQMLIFVTAHLADGTTIDATNKIPARIYQIGQDGRPHFPSSWKRYLMNVTHRDRYEERRYFVRYLCRYFNQNSQLLPAQAVSLDLSFYYISRKKIWSQQMAERVKPAINENHSCTAPKLENSP